MRKSAILPDLNRSATDIKVLRRPLAPAELGLEPRAEPAVLQRLLGGQEVVADLDDACNRLLDPLSDAVSSGAHLLSNLGVQQVVVEADHDRDEFALLLGHKSSLRGRIGMDLIGLDAVDLWHRSPSSVDHDRRFAPSIARKMVV